MPSSLLIAAPPAPYEQKERLYRKARQAEGRWLSDEALRGLPEQAPYPALRQEWRWRRRSFVRFERYLEYKNRPGAPHRLLDLGCGNGWMSNRLAQHPQRTVWGMDLNMEELTQATRVFGRENLRFIYADVENSPDLTQSVGTFDYIVLAASVQYFPDLTRLLRSLQVLLRPGGEVHLLDSAFYPDESARKAAYQRSEAYYTRIGVPEMAGHYYHHVWPEARQLGAENLNASVKTLFLQQLKWLPPFPWLRFRF